VLCAFHAIAQFFHRRLLRGRGVQLGVLAFLSALARSKIRRRGLRCAAFFHGLVDSGHLDTQVLCAILSRLDHGVHEIMCHPGFETPALRHRYPWGYTWESEAVALRSFAVKELVERRGIGLRSFAEAWCD
jgi:chitin disaccharide deacetylase